MSALQRTSAFLRAAVGAVARTINSKLSDVVSVKDFGAKGDGATDDTAAIQAAITASAAGSVIHFPRGNYKITGALQVNTQNITLRGTGPNTKLQYYGNGAAIQLGTDDGLMYDAANYNGPAQGFGLEYMTLECLNSGAAGQLRTALLNSISGRYYGTGTYGIRDWRGGYTRIVNCSIYGFAFGYWGVQADLNSWQDVTLGYNSVAAFIGPGSDQGIYQHIWTFGNDSVWVIHGARQTRIVHWTSDTDGSGTTAPAIIRNSAPALSAKYAGTRQHSNIVFDQPWLEQMGSLGAANPGYNVHSVFEINVGDAALGGGVVIRSPFVATYDQGDATKPHFYYLCNVGYTVQVDVENCSGSLASPWGACKALFYIDAASPACPRVFFSDADGQYGSRLIENYNAAACFFQFRTDGFTNAYGYNVLGGTGVVHPGGFGIHRRMVSNASPHVVGFGGDITLNRGFSAGKTWAWVFEAAQAKSVVIHSPTVGADRGDVALTLTPETDHEYQTLSANLTAARDWILAAPPVATIGNRFLVTRSGGGAFNLSIRNLNGGGAILKAMPASSWAEFMYDGANWTLRAYGAL